MWIDNFYDLLFYQGGIGWRCYIKIVHVPFGISSTVEIRFINTLYIALEAARDLNYLGEVLGFLSPRWLLLATLCQFSAVVRGKDRSLRTNLDN